MKAFVISLKEMLWKTNLIQRRLQRKKGLKSREMGVEGSQYHSRRKWIWQLLEFSKRQENTLEGQKNIPNSPSKCKKEKTINTTVQKKILQYKASKFASTAFFKWALKSGFLSFDKHHIPEKPLHQVWSVNHPLNPKRASFRTHELQFSADYPKQSFRVLGSQPQEWACSAESPISHWSHCLQ